MMMMISLSVNVMERENSRILVGAAQGSVPGINNQRKSGARSPV